MFHIANPDGGKSILGVLHRLLIAPARSVSRSGLRSAVNAFSPVTHISMTKATRTQDGLIILHVTLPPATAEASHRDDGRLAGIGEPRFAPIVAGRRIPITAPVDPWCPIATVPFPPGAPVPVLSMPAGTATVPFCRHRWR